MEFTIEKLNNVSIVKINLEKASLKYADKFREYLLDAFEGKKEKIIVDFTNSKFIDSTFLGTLVVCFKKLSTDGSQLKIVCQGKVKFIICEITKLSSVFDVYENLAIALDEFNEKELI